MEQTAGIAIRESKKRSKSLIF